jgi:glycosyltransferase involved in cell wall biosynthesis
VSERRSRVIVVMPAYNAARTVEKTVAGIPPGSVDEVLLVDDASQDDTVAVARRLGLVVVEHPENRGYGGNQKTCYTLALERGADVVVMVHPDYQYDPRLIPYMVAFIEHGICDVVLGNRVRSRRYALGSGMPIYKYLSNRALTIVENFVLQTNLGECHSGMRAYSRRVLETIPFLANSDDFVFDSQVIAQCAYFGFNLGDVPVPCRYMPETSQINFRRSVTYGLGTVATLASFILQKTGVVDLPIFRANR